MWTLLRNLADWEKYQLDTSKQLGLVGAVGISWGNGPKAFPCLVCTYAPPGAPPRLVSAYVYEEDAELLLGAAGKKRVLPEKTPDGMPARQVDCNRWMIGNIMAIVKTLREMSILKDAKYEEDLAEALEMVDMQTADRKAKLSSQDQALLDRLEPGG